MCKLKSKCAWLQEAATGMAEAVMHAAATTNAAAAPTGAADLACSPDPAKSDAEKRMRNGPRKAKQAKVQGVANTVQQTVDEQPEDEQVRCMLCACTSTASMFTHSGACT